MTIAIAELMFQLASRRAVSAHRAMHAAAIASASVPNPCSCMSSVGAEVSGRFASPRLHACSPVIIDDVPDDGGTYEQRGCRRRARDMVSRVRHRVVDTTQYVATGFPDGVGFHAFKR
jgi:hypothetical protein